MVFELNALAVLWLLSVLRPGETLASEPAWYLIDTGFSGYFFFFLSFTPSVPICL